MELLLLAFLILLNGVFAMSEMAVVSSRKARLQQWADEGKTGAQAALALANEPASFLSTIQVGITVIGITSGAFGEATLAKGFGEWLSRWSLLAPYAEVAALVVVVAVITLASLIVGELVPKRLALVNPESIASIVARPLTWLARVAHPVVRLLSATTEAVLRLFGVRPSSEPPVTEEEIKVLMEQGAEAGVFEQHEQAIVARVFRLDQLKVTAVMTPRTQIVRLNIDEPLAVNLERIAQSGHSRFPVGRTSSESIEGIVQTNTLLEAAIAGRPIDLGVHMSKPLYVPQSLSVVQLMESFKKHRQTIAVIVNEHGDLQGLVTLNDVMEALVGDIATVEDDEEREIVERDDGSWLMDGQVAVERFKDVVDARSELPEEQAYRTLGGFAMHQLGRVPKMGDRFDWNGLRIEVLDMDGHRVDKVLVTRTST